MDISKITRTVRNVLPLKYCGAVIVAAGASSRMKGIDKVMAELGGEPMLVHTVRAFDACDAIREIVIVTRAELLETVMDLCRGFSKVKTVVAGGADRAESVENGIRALSDKVRLVAVQDGARPLITNAVIDRVVRAAHTYGAAVPAVPVKDTIKYARGGMVQETPDRRFLQAVQTPQAFDLDLLSGALQKAKQDKAVITDDASVVERLGMSVKLVEGDERNIKITTPVDLQIAAQLLEETQ